MRALKRFMYRIGFPVREFLFSVLGVRSPGVKCLLVHEGRVLGIRHTYGKPWWTLPGGGVKKGESEEHAVRREVREELGLEVKSVRSLGTFTKQNGRAVYTVACFFAEPSADMPLKLQNDEIAEAAWFPVDAFPSFCSPVVEFVFQRYRAFPQNAA